MKYFLIATALIFGASMAIPASATDAKAACEKSGGVWKDNGDGKGFCYKNLKSKYDTHFDIMEEEDMGDPLGANRPDTPASLQGSSTATPSTLQSVNDNSNSKPLANPSAVEIDGPDAEARTGEIIGAINIAKGGFDADTKSIEIGKCFSEQEQIACPDLTKAETDKPKPRRRRHSLIDRGGSGIMIDGDDDSDGEIDASLADQSSTLSNKTDEGTEVFRQEFGQVQAEKHDIE